MILSTRPRRSSSRSSSSWSYQMFVGHLMKLRRIRTPPLIHTSPQNTTHKIPHTESESSRDRDQKCYSIMSFGIAGRRHRSWSTRTKRPTRRSGSPPAGTKSSSSQFSVVEWEMGKNKRWAAAAMALLGDYSTAGGLNAERPIRANGHRRNCGRRWRCWAPYGCKDASPTDRGRHHCRNRAGAGVGDLRHAPFLFERLKSGRNIPASAIEVGHDGTRLHKVWRGDLDFTRSRFGETAPQRMFYRYSLPAPPFRLPHASVRPQQLQPTTIPQNGPTRSSWSTRTKRPTRGSLGNRSAIHGKNNCIQVICCSRRQLWCVVAGQRAVVAGQRALSKKKNVTLSRANVRAAAWRVAKVLGLPFKRLEAKYNKATAAALAKIAARKAKKGAESFPKVPPLLLQRRGRSSPQGSSEEGSRI